MKAKCASLMTAGLAGLAILPAAVGAEGRAPPTATTGVTPRAIGAVDLGSEFEGMAGRELRARLVTVEPGGIFGIHGHQQRPGTVYVVQGKIVEHRNGAAKEFGPGEAWFEDSSTTHWLENTGTAPAVLIAVDIFKRP